MSTGLIGYHPQRVAELRLAAQRAVDHLLRAPQMQDPLAGVAMSAARLALVDLEQDWLPALSRVSGSNAMTEFGSFGLTALAGWSGGLPSQVPGPPGGIPPSFGMSNAEAQAAADAAKAAGTPGVFVGRTKTYEVLETAPSTSVPYTGHDPNGGSGQHDVIVTENWYFEHNLTAPPAPYGASPGGLLGRALTTIARLLEDEPDRVPLERGLMYEQLTKEARDWGSVSGQKNAAYGRLTTTDGDTTEVQRRPTAADTTDPASCQTRRTGSSTQRSAASTTPRSRSWKTPQHGSIRATTASSRSSPSCRRAIRVNT